MAASICHGFGGPGRAALPRSVIVIDGITGLWRSERKRRGNPSLLYYPGIFVAACPCLRRSSKSNRLRQHSKAKIGRQCFFGNSPFLMTSPRFALSFERCQDSFV